MTGQSSLATVTATLCLQCVFKMAVSIQNPAKCEVRTVIGFLHAKEETAAEIHHRRDSVHGKNVMKKENVAKWCPEFEAGRSDVTDDIIQKIDENICADRRLTIDELHQKCPEVSRTVLHG
jgi:hypothetical protein